MNVPGFDPFIMGPTPTGGGGPADRQAGGLDVEAGEGSAGEGEEEEGNLSRGNRSKRPAPPAAMASSTKRAALRTVRVDNPETLVSIMKDFEGGPHPSLACLHAHPSLADSPLNIQGDMEPYSQCVSFPWLMSFLTSATGLRPLSCAGEVCQPVSHV